MNEAELKEQQEQQKKIKAANDKVNSDRLSRLEEIADNRQEVIDQEEGQISDADRAARDSGARKEEKPEETEVTQEERYARALPEETTEEVKQDEDSKVVNGETYYRQIVNGREVWQTLKQIRDTAQKVASADEYLHTAKESVRKATELALPHEDESAGLSKDEARKLLSAYQMGDEEAADKLASLLTRPSVSPDVLQQIDQRLSFRTEQSSLEERSRDLLEDRYMGRLFRTRINELKAENPNMTLREAYTSIDSELRSAFPGFKTSKLKEKEARKRTLPQPVTSAQRSGVSGGEESEEGDITSAIEEMAKARGKSPILTADKLSKLGR